MAEGGGAAAGRPPLGEARGRGESRAAYFRPHLLYSRAMAIVLRMQHGEHFPTNCKRLLATRSSLLERHEAGRLGGTNTGGTVLHRLVGNGELTEVVSHHIGLNLNLVENLAVVHSHHGSDHLGKDDHVAKVSLDALWLLAILWPGDSLLGSPQALEKRIVLALEAVLETMGKRMVGT